MRKEGCANLYIVASRHRRIKQLCLCAVHILILIAVTISQIGCSHSMGTIIVKAPNAGKSVLELGQSDSKTLFANGVDYQLRVPVGPPKASLSVWIIEPKYEAFNNKDITVPRGTIFILHGYKASKANDVYLTWARKFTQAGYRSVLVDLRGHGHSTGDWLTFGVVESRDISQVINALSERDLLAGKVGVFGRSYGAAVAIQLAALDPRVQTVVAIEPFRSMREMIPHFSRKAMGAFAFVFPVSDEQWKKGIDQAGLVAGFDTYNASAYKAVTKTNTPIMFIHGKNDVMVPPWHSQTMYEQTTGPSRLLLIDNENHKTLGTYNIDRIQYDVIDWFNSWL